MLIPIKKLITTSLVSMLVLAPVSTGGLILTVDAAFAGANKDKREQSVPREKWAALPKDSQGHLHASANSNIGMIATYGVSEIVPGDAKSTYDAYDIVEMSGLDCGDTAGSVGSAQCSDISVYETYTNSDAVYLTSLALMQEGVGDAPVQTGPAFAAFGADELSDPAREYFRELLSFADFSLSQPEESEFSENIPINDAMIDVSLTF